MFGKVKGEFGLIRQKGSNEVAFMEVENVAEE